MRLQLGACTYLCFTFLCLRVVLGAPLFWQEGVTLLHALLDGTLDFWIALCSTCVGCWMCNRMQTRELRATTGISVWQVVLLSSMIVWQALIYGLTVSMSLRSSSSQPWHQLHHSCKSLWCMQTGRRIHMTPARC